MDTKHMTVSSPTLPLLTLTKEEFAAFYPDLADYYSFFASPIKKDITSKEFERRYLTNKLWRLNNLYTVINKKGQPVRFKMNKAQHKVYAASRKHPRLLILKSRQQGISTFWLVSFFDDALFCPYLNVGLMAQGTDEASMLLERTKFLWQTLNADVKKFLGIELVKDNLKEIGFSNHSTIFIRVSFRSATLQRLHVSEYGKIANAFPQRAKETKTGTLQALAKGNTGIIESTAEGDNDFKRMWNVATIAANTGQLTVKDFAPVFLSWLDDPDCALETFQEETKEATEYFDKLKEQDIFASQEQKNFWIAQYRELGSDIYQEYPATPEEAFAATKNGMYYADLFRANVVQRGKLRKDVYDKNLPVHVFFDIGVDDYYVLGFVQWYKDEYRIIDEFWDNGKWLGYYLDIAFSKGYDIVSLNYPHDIKVREQGSKGEHDTANRRIDIVKEYMRKHNYKARVNVLERTSEADGIEAVRRMIPKLVVDQQCTYLISCFMNFSKEWDEKLQMWKKTPKESEFNHGADVLRGIALGLRESSNQNPSRQELQSKYERASKGYDV